jgi:cyclophilin family peptidyl-prolyl cis-trans isomerase/HEAT repeat protein
MFVKRNYLLLLPFLLLFIHCRPLQDEKLTDVHWDFSDPEIVKLYNFQDQQNVDSLLVYFHHANPTYRYGAAMAFGSFKDKRAVDGLKMLLQDEIIEVRDAAAYALGQIGEAQAESSLIAAFVNNDSIDLTDKLNSTILTAIGKLGSEKQLLNLSTIKTYLRADTLLLEGQAKGIYHFALRNMILPEGTAKMVDFIVRRGYPQPVRLIASNYLLRAKGIALDSMAILELGRVLEQDVDPNVRMALMVGLGKTKSLAALQHIQNRLNIEKDYRVKCQAIRALYNYDYVLAAPIVTAMLVDPNAHVSTTAANYFVDNGNPREANTYWQRARDSSLLHWPTKMTLYKAANKHMSAYFEVTKSQVNREIKQILATAQNPYQKAAALDAFAEYGWNYASIKSQNFDGEGNVVRTASVEALAKIARAPNFATTFSLSAKRVKQELADAFTEIITKRDPAMTAVAAAVLREPNLDFKAYLDSLDFLQSTLDKLALPREVETYNELKKTIDYFSDKENTEPYKIPYNHPIDWEIFNGISKTVKAEIKTSKGNITLQLMPDKAPGTVVNFVQLAKNGFFNGKNFHRVVSNFVIQGGCPRGDGYGALDYTIRSELPPAYFDQEGLVGMASAGNHTECTQFFITHSPAFHLDGNYTIFARVVGGMEAVHSIEQGDLIESVTIN